MTRPTNERLLTLNEVQDIADKNNGMGLRTVPDLISAQDAKTARILIEKIDNLIIGVDGCDFGERLDGDKGCLVLDMNQNQWNKFKATHLKGEKG